ncbi:MAG: hypothetical protein JW973_17830 [Bacteroidales bacterium]|nr:hypothetical protein [Bacteroidales bacterium]
MKIFSQNEEQTTHNVLYINSYGITYPWADSVAAGVLSTFSERDDVQLFIEHLDAKRFGSANFSDLFVLYKKKYRNISFDIAIASDNDALDFLIQFGDS